MDFINSDGEKLYFTEIFERFDGITESTDETKFVDLIYYFKGNNGGKRFDDFENGTKLFEKNKSGDMKLEEEKKHQNVFKSSLNDLKRKRYKSVEQKKCSFKDYHSTCTSKKQVIHLKIY